MRFLTLFLWVIGSIPCYVQAQNKPCHAIQAGKDLAQTRLKGSVSKFSSLTLLKGAGAALPCDTFRIHFAQYDKAGRLIADIQKDKNDNPAGAGCSLDSVVQRYIYDITGCLIKSTKWTGEASAITYRYENRGDSQLCYWHREGTQAPDLIIFDTKRKTEFQIEKGQIKTKTVWSQGQQVTYNYQFKNGICTGWSSVKIDTAGNVVTEQSIDSSEGKVSVIGKKITVSGRQGRVKQQIEFNASGDQVFRLSYRYDKKGAEKQCRTYRNGTLESHVYTTTHYDPMGLVTEREMRTSYPRKRNMPDVISRNIIKKRDLVGNTLEELHINYSNTNKADTFWYYANIEYYK